jgi:hypothetical protein
MPDDRIPPPRLFLVVYTRKRLRDERGRFCERKVTRWAKCPYAGLFGLTETLTRALATHEIDRFTLRPARAKEITPEVRAALVRWNEALDSDSDVRWNA